MIGNKSITILIVFIAISATIIGLLGRFDRYSAEMRVIYDRYRNTSLANPAMEELEVLFRVAEWRHPEWTQDRLLELVAGKDIETLLLLLMIQEHGINPLSDWHLYRRLKSRAAKIVRAGGTAPAAATSSGSPPHA